MTKPYPTQDQRTHARLLDESLDDVAQGVASFAELIARFERTYPQVAEDLRVISAVAAAQPPATELHAARDHIAERLEAAFLTDLYGAARERDHAAHVWSRRALIAAAVVGLSGAGGWGVSQASAAALPDSALYGVKRSEETLALLTAWSDQRRGAVLITIANRRLDEAQYEAARGNDTQARGLIAEFDRAVRQVIRLVATMNAQRENSARLITALGATLDSEQRALVKAQRQGHAALDQALRGAAQGQQQDLAKNHVAAPGGATPGGATPNGATPTETNAQHNAGGSPHAKPPMPASTRTPEPHPTATGTPHGGSGKS